MTERLDYPQWSDSDREPAINAVFSPDALPSKADVKRLFPTPLEQGTPEWKSQWYAHFERPDAKIYELWTREYITGLASYVRERTAIYASLGYPRTATEVGAGNGRLSGLLNDADDETEYIATDNGSYAISSLYPVQRLGASEALKRHNSPVVIASWISHMEDWTGLFRAHKSVQEYILIGDPEWTGRPWETWGVDWMMYLKNPDQKPPYEVEGFKKVHLRELSAHQVCRTDQPPSFSASATYAFVRQL